MSEDAIQCVVLNSITDEEIVYSFTIVVEMPQSDITKASVSVTRTIDLAVVVCDEMCDSCDENFILEQFDLPQEKRVLNKEWSLFTDRDDVAKILANSRGCTSCKANDVGVFDVIEMYDPNTCTRKTVNQRICVP